MIMSAVVYPPTAEAVVESPRESKLVVRRQDLRHRFLPLRSGIHPLAHILDASRVSNKGE